MGALQGQVSSVRNTSNREFPVLFSEPEYNRLLHKGTCDEESNLTWFNQLTTPLCLLSPASIQASAVLVSGLRGGEQNRVGV